MTPGERPDDLTGRTVSDYRILAKLGEGGMGIVYKAEHPRLGKLVALKFLRAESLADEDSRLRFLNEARTAAALDNSSICPVYDFDEQGDHAYISMAYLEGKSLHERIVDEPLDVNDALLVAIQIAEGLQEAHRHDIVHRDIKPSNILFNEKGDAKIVDFGLARIKDTSRLTRTGMVVGTTCYMSPEQATGGEIDHRTDIWSLGVVLYEMLTGRPPFTGRYPEAVAYAVVHEDPAPLTGFPPEVLPGLERLLERCLAKKPQDRYEDCAELLTDLRRLRGSGTNEVQRLRDWIVENAGRLLVAGLAVLAVVVAIWVVYLIIVNGNGVPNPITEADAFQVTSEEAWEGDPALSPDGTRIAYTKSIAGNHDIYVVNAKGGSPLRLTYDPAFDRDPCWLPDGSALLFASDRGGEYGVWQVDQLGGPPKLVVPSAQDPAVSTDGGWLAFGRLDASGALRIAVMPLTGGSAPRILTGPEDGPESHHHPAWSPDGSWICYATLHNLWLVSPADGKTHRLLDAGIADDHPVWSRDGKRIYFSSHRGNSVALWVVNANGRGPQRRTMGSSGGSHPSISADGRRFAYATSTGENDEDVVIFDRRTGTTAGLSGEEHDSFQPTISADGTLLAFVSDRQEGRNEVWLQTLADGKPVGEPRRLTDQPGNVSHPALSPDGRWVAYYRTVDLQRDLWVAATDGGQPERITEDADGDYHPAWSPDGRRLTFTSDREGGQWRIWSVPIAKGQRAGDLQCHSPVQLTAGFPAWSSDGGSIAYIGHHEGHNYPFVAPVDDPDAAVRIDAVVDAHRVRWVRSTGEIWVSSHPLEGPIPIRAMTADLQATRELDPPFAFHANVDWGLFDTDGEGRLIVYSLPKREGNIWLLELEEGAF